MKTRDRSIYRTGSVHSRQKKRGVVCDLKRATHPCSGSCSKSEERAKLKSAIKCPLNVYRLHRLSPGDNAVHGLFPTCCAPHTILTGGHLTMTTPPRISFLVTTISQASFLPLTVTHSLGAGRSFNSELETEYPQSGFRDHANVSTRCRWQTSQTRNHSQTLPSAQEPPYTRRLRSARPSRKKLTG